MECYDNSTEGKPRCCQVSNRDDNVRQMKSTTGVFDCLERQYVPRKAIQWTGENANVLLAHIKEYAVRLEFGRGSQREQRMFAQYAEDQDWFEVNIGDYFTDEHNKGWVHYPKKDFEDKYATE